MNNTEKKMQIKNMSHYAIFIPSAKWDEIEALMKDSIEWYDAAHHQTDTGNHRMNISCTGDFITQMRKITGESND